MAKMRKAKKTPAAQVVAPPVRNYPRKAVITLAAAVFVGLGFAAYAGNAVLHGHVSITDHRTPTPSKAGVSAPTEAARVTEAPARNQPAVRAALVDKYGDAATSPAVASAIRDIEAKSPSKRAVAAADRYEALLHGHPTPGTDPTSLLMAGYVPPGMDPYTASMLSRSLPKLPRMPRTGPLTPAEIDQMAGMPTDPQDAMLASLGTSRAQIDAANQAQFERYMREEHGPVYMPPLHADHTWLAEHATKTAKGFVITKDYDGSIREMTDSSGNVVSEITYDPWGVPTQIAGSGPLPDKLFQGMYYHPRSGNYLTLFRTYNPTLGRWLSRDPLGEGSDANLYSFAGNNPINFADPLGLYYEVVQNGTTNGIQNVTINAPLTYPANASQADINAQINAINSQWTVTFGNTNVTMNAFQSNSNQNVIDFSNTGTKRTAFVPPPGMQAVPNGTLMSGLVCHGHWNPKSPGRTPHEFGHLLGLGHTTGDLGNLMGPNIFATGINSGQILRVVGGSPWPAANK